MKLNKIVVGALAVISGFGMAGVGGGRAEAGNLLNVAPAKLGTTIYSDRTKWILPGSGVGNTLIDSGAGAGSLSYGDIGQDGTASGSKLVGKYISYGIDYSERDGAADTTYGLYLIRSALAADSSVSNHQFLFIGAKGADSTHVFGKGATSGTELYSIVGSSDWLSATYSGYSGFVIPACMINQLQYASLVGGSTAFTSSYALAVYGYDAPNNMVNGSSRDITLSVDSKTTQASIVAGVSAKDFFGVSCSVAVKSSDYVVGKVGNYTIVLIATDTYGNTATGTLNIHVVDRTAPVVTKKSDISVRYGTSLTAAECLTHYTLTDNVDTTFTTAWTLPSNFTFGSALAYGNYTLTLSVKDSAGNETKVSVPVNVFDDIPPVISRKDGGTDSVLIYGYSNVHLVTEAALLALYTATDVISGSCSLYLKSGSVDTTIGDHSLVIAAKDSIGNEAVKTINYRIQVDVPPVFILSDSLIQVTASIPLSINDLTKAIAAIPTSVSSGTAAANVVGGGHVLSARKFFARTNIVVNSDDFNAYLAGSAIVGAKYAVRYTYVDDTTGEVKDSIVYLLVAADPVEDKKDDGTDQVNPFVNFFVHMIPEFFEKLTNWFVGVFEKGKWDCFITDKEWYVRFPAAAAKASVDDSADGSAAAVSVSVGSEASAEVSL